MAKKNLSALMNGLITSPGDPRENISVPEKETQAKGPGRPRLRPAGKEEVRTTFLLDKTLLAKLRYIALADRKSMKNIVEDTLTTFVNDWESNNAPVPDELL